MMKLISLISIVVILFANESVGQTINGIDYSGLKDVYNTFDLSSDDIFGQRFASESLTIKDPVTGTSVIALTTSRFNNSKIYQDQPNWTSDGRYIVFRSNRVFNKELNKNIEEYYAVSTLTHEIIQITSGTMSGNLVLGRSDNVAFYFRGQKLIKLELGNLINDSENGKVKSKDYYEKIIGEIPNDIRPGQICLDKDDDVIFFTVVSQDRKSSIFYKISTLNGDFNKLIEVPFWVGHLQTNPWKHNEIMYCWETRGDSPQRIWILTINEDGSINNRPGYKEGPKEWVTHEFFVNEDHILFNVMGHLDRLKEEPTGIFMVNVRTGDKKFIGQTDEPGGLWHVCGTPDLKWVIGDTFDGNVYQINATTGVKTLLTSKHRPDSKGPFTKEAHTHQSISPDGKFILINSSWLTSSDIMLVPLKL